VCVHILCTSTLMCVAPERTAVVSHLKDSDTMMFGYILLNADVPDVPERLSARGLVVQEEVVPALLLLRVLQTTIQQTLFVH